MDCDTIPVKLIGDDKKAIPLPHTLNTRTYERVEIKTNANMEYVNEKINDGLVYIQNIRSPSDIYRVICYDNCVYAIYDKHHTLQHCWNDCDTEFGSRDTFFNNRYIDGFNFYIHTKKDKQNLTRLSINSLSKKQTKPTSKDQVFGYVGLNKTIHSFLGGRKRKKRRKTKSKQRRKTKRKSRKSN